jgi:ADP-ribosylglycohydrolase
MDEKENPMKGTIGYESRAKGCMAGLACGDAMGDVGRNQAFRDRYGIIDDMYDGAKSTDDTEFAVLTAKTLLDCGGELTVEALVDSWKRRILDQGGLFDRGGVPLYGAVDNLRRGLRPPLSGRYNTLNMDDGAAMRIAPIGIIARDEAHAASLAEIEASISHYEDGVYAAVACAVAVRLCMEGASAPEAVAAAARHVPEDSWLGLTMGRMLALAKEAGSIEAAWARLHTDFYTPRHSMSPEAIPQAFGIFLLTGGDFRKGMFWASNFGRDADTIAALVGAFSGARQGIEVIPEAWIERVRKPAGVCLKFAASCDIVELGGELARLGARFGH